MAKIALYQKYRSSTFDEVVGQEYVVRSIQNAVRNHKTGHAYLFCGPRGTGKTTMARLLAKSVNCEHPEIAPCGECENCKAAINGIHPDIIEINAANETHVEDIRELIERSSLAPMMGKNKVYIIDEVHQLSSAASSALLKTLEEPPANVIFVLATTDPQKLLPTIISRCQRFDFTKVRLDQIQQHLLNIAKNENIQMEEQAAEMIAELSDGGMRDALSIMDQCASYTSDHITVDAIDQIYGLTTTKEKENLLNHILETDLASLLDQIDSYRKRGIDLQRYSDGLIDILKDIVIYQNTNRPELLKKLTKEEADAYKDRLSTAKCMDMCNVLLDMKAKFKNATDLSLIFEITCLSLATKKEEPVEQKIIQPVPMPKFEIKKETEKNEEYVPQVQQIQEYDVNQILSLLVQCNKQCKQEDETKFATIDSLTALEQRKYTTLLKQTKIAASGKDCIILISGQKAIVNRINEDTMNRELYNFIKDTLQIDKMIYAIHETAFKDATTKFRQAMQSNTLPAPLVIQRYQEAVTKEETPEDKVLQLFGSENVEIVG